MEDLDDEKRNKQESVGEENKSGGIWRSEVYFDLNNNNKKMKDERKKRKKNVGVEW